MVARWSAFSGYAAAGPHIVAGIDMPQLPYTGMAMHLQSACQL